jgi:hypothetical protein
MLIDRIVEIQKRDGLTDKEMAQKLGYHRVSWLRIRQRKVFGQKFLIAVRRNYPELSPEIDLFLCANATPRQHLAEK